MREEDGRSSFGRGGREAEGTALLRRHTGNCIEGSNPSLSAANDYAAIAQLDRASVYGTEGRRFESSWARQREAAGQRFEIVAVLGSKLCPTRGPLDCAEIGEACDGKLRVIASLEAANATA